MVVMEKPLEALEPLIYDISVPGRIGVNLPKCDVPESELPTDLLRTELKLPEVSCKLYGTSSS